MDHRLIALDMDGTLLDGEGNIPVGFAGVFAEARAQGVTIAPASGRQLVTLRDMFSGELEPDAFIAENGTVVAHRGEIVSLIPMGPEAVHRIIDATRSAGPALDLVLCTPFMAYVDGHCDPSSMAEISRYYHATRRVDDLHDVVGGNVVKLAAHCHPPAEQVVPALTGAADGTHLAVSGRHWIDMMDPTANKGRALRELGRALGLERSRTMAFGDYLNDYELLQAAGTSYAMANAHPRIREIADHTAPPNTEHGVITVLRELLGM